MRRSPVPTGETAIEDEIPEAAVPFFVSASTTSKATPDREKLAANAASAKTVGTLAAQAALGKPGGPGAK